MELVAAVVVMLALELLYLAVLLPREHAAPRDIPDREPSIGRLNSEASLIADNIA